MNKSFNFLNEYLNVSLSNMTMDEKIKEIEKRWKFHENDNPLEMSHSESVILVGCWKNDIKILLSFLKQEKEK